MKFKLFGTKIYISFLFCATLCLMLVIDRTGLIIPTLFGALMANYAVTKAEQPLTFAVLNLVLALFNLLPVSGLDGGTLLTLFIAKFTDIYKAESIVRIVTVAFAFIAFLLGVYLWVSGTVNISVFIVALYLAVCGMVKK